MLNHARTLLMNVDGSAPFLDCPAEELVDLSYRRLALPGALLRVRAALFGADPDRAMLNYRCRQLLAAAHASPLEEYVLALDPRVTYDFADETLVPAAAFGAVVAPATGLTVFGDADPPDAAGRVRHSLLVTTTGDGVAEVERTSAPIQKLVFRFAAGGTVPVLGTGLTARLAATDAGQQYALTVTTRPRRTLVELVDLAAALGEPTLNYLIGVTRVEPYATFRAIWFRKPEAAMRAAALTCALAYRTDEVRRG